MFSKRTKLSLIQLLILSERAQLFLLLDKYDIADDEMRYWGPNQETGWIIRKASESILSAAPERVSALITEVVGTLSALRAAVSPRYQFDARAWDLERNFALDGYRIEGRNLVAIDPTVPGTTALDDDLDALLSFSALPDRSAIRISLEKSAEDFKKQPPDFNVCLTNVRVALEMSAKSIANQRGWQPSGEARWGEAVSYLRQSGFIAADEEAGIAGIYSFVSPALTRW